MSQDENISKIEQFFKIPEDIQDQIKNVVEKVRGGYELIETRPRWDGSPGSWTRHGIARIIFHQPSGKWKVYWHRASGKWDLYAQYTHLGGALASIKRDSQRCFWG